MLGRAGWGESAGQAENRDLFAFHHIFHFKGVGAYRAAFPFYFDKLIQRAAGQTITDFDCHD
jgi:hypothetical protein